MQDGTVLSALPDPNATVRLDNRPTNSETAQKKGSLTFIIIAIVSVLLLAVIVAVGAVVVYVMSPNRTGTAANPSATPSVGLTRNQSTDAQPTKDEVSRTIEQMNGEIGTALVHSDAETLDRLLAEDYHYENDLGLRLTKQQLLSLIRTGNLHYDFATSTNSKVDVDNNLTRVMFTAQAQIKGQLQGRPFNDRYTYTNTYEKRSNGWQLVLERAWYR
jgi:hypothetical protein